MDAALTKAIDYGARQVVILSDASPRLDVNKLPIVRLTEPKLVRSLLCDRYTSGGL